MTGRRGRIAAAIVAACGGAAWCFAGCTSNGTLTPGTGDAGTGEDAAATDAGAEAATAVDAASNDSAALDAPYDGPTVLTGMAVVSTYGAPLGAAPGDALPLKVVFTFSDGTTEDLPPSAQVTWITPATVTAQDPNDAGATSPIPAPGAQPTAFYIANPYRPERTDYPGVLFVIDPGTVSDAGVTVTAQLGDGGRVSAVVPIHAAPAGDPDAGGNLFQNVLICAGCHGQSGAGSPQALLDDGGLLFDDAGDPLYLLQGLLYPYPAPGLNNSSTDDGGSPNVAADPAWNAALVGMAAQGDMDNLGVGLRHPMPDWLGRTNAAGAPLSGQDFANIYAWLKTQTQ